MKKKKKKKTKNNKVESRFIEVGNGDNEYIKSRVCEV